MKSEGAGPKGPVALRSDVITVANILSIFRILLVPLFLWSILNGLSGKALLIFCVAGITDLLDGFAARLWQQRSRLGTVLDPAGDKLLVATSYVALTIPALASPNHIPLWLTVTVFARDLLIVGGALFAYLTWRQKTFMPSFLGKISTGCQVGMIFLVLLSNYRVAVPWYMAWIYWITLFWTLVSGVQYFIFGLAVLRSRRKSSPLT
jgi:cardiolipin synthase (CMP-forming)